MVPVPLGFLKSGNVDEATWVETTYRAHEATQVHAPQETSALK